jgi:hypothetical protein
MHTWDWMHKLLIVLVNSSFELNELGLRQKIRSNSGLNKEACALVNVQAGQDQCSESRIFRNRGSH